MKGSNHAVPGFTSINEDVLVEIARYLSLQDILSIAQTGKFIRHLVSLSKSVWLATDNAFLLPPPPLGNILDLCASELHQCAVRAVRLQRNWRNPEPHLVMASQHKPVGLDVRKQTHIHIFSGARWVLIMGGRWVWCVSVPTHRTVVKQEVDGRILQGDVEEVEEGRAIIVSFVHRDGDLPCHLEVLRVALPNIPADELSQRPIHPFTPFHFSQQNAIPQAATSLLSLPLGSGINPWQVSLCGNTASILVMDTEELTMSPSFSVLVVDWRRRCAAKIHLGKGSHAYALQRQWIGLKTLPAHILIHEWEEDHSVIVIPDLQPNPPQDHHKWKTFGFPTLERAKVSFRRNDEHGTTVISSYRWVSSQFHNDCTITLVSVGRGFISHHHLEFSLCEKAPGDLRLVRETKLETDDSRSAWYTQFGGSGLRGVYLLGDRLNEPFLLSLVAFGFDGSSQNTYRTLQTPPEMNLRNIAALSFDDLRGTVCALLNDGTIWFLHYA